MFKSNVVSISSAPVPPTVANIREAISMCRAGLTTVHLNAELVMEPEDLEQFSEAAHQLLAAVREMNEGIKLAHARRDAATK